MEIDAKKIKQHITEGRSTFEQVWPHFPEGDKEFAAKWFVMAYAGQQMRIDELEERLQQIETEQYEQHIFGN